MGGLGVTAEMIPLTVTVRSWASGVEHEKQLRFNVFVHPKWTPTLLMITAYDCLQDLNEGTSDEATYTLRGRIEFEGLKPLELLNTVTTTEGQVPVPPPLQVALWWGERFNRLYGLAEGPPKIRRAECTIEMRPQRNQVTIENALLDSNEVEPGGEIRGRVVLRAAKGGAETREFRLKAPLSINRGEHRVVIADSDTMNRAQSASIYVNRHLTAEEAVSLLSQERPNSQVNIALMESRPTVYDDDRALAAVPQSVLNVMNTARASRPMVATPETVRVSESIPLDGVVAGSVSLHITVK